MLSVSNALIMLEIDVLKKKIKFVSQMMILQKNLRLIISIIILLGSRMRA